MFEFKVAKTDLFKKLVKKLSKKYRNIEKQITLIYIYSKSDMENINEKQLDEIISKSFLK